MPTHTRLLHVVVHAIMSLDLILFRADQGGDPDRMRDTQAKRFKDVSHVDKVIETDSQWRKCNTCRLSAYFILLLK